jgi:hypothetical protein
MLESPGNRRLHLVWGFGVMNPKSSGIRCVHPANSQRPCVLRGLFIGLWYSNVTVGGSWSSGRGLPLALSLMASPKAGHFVRKVIFQQIQRKPSHAPTCDSLNLDIFT